MTSLSLNNYDVIDIFCGVFLLVYFGPKQTLLYCFPCPGDQFGNTPIFFPIAVINHKQWNHSTVKEERKGELERDMIRESFGLPAVMHTHSAATPIAFRMHFLQALFLIHAMLDTINAVGYVTLKLSSCSSSHGINCQNHCLLP